ncbi:serine/threonine protein kinase [Dietzia natronolimnaea]|uniref:non-specific serine/threonine protein kinase n=1 Tax=Dietzia natronolimnaea TaxID=161920 RepID=A0A2A2WQ65_9ACTN|nr:serine/threonine-protein kinase [Dietzia natronolimnaea]PAY23328.1 serine/threonine protein kinase [Dietzia natronolimnaea]
MSRRAPAREPRLSGYVFIRHLGSGGFADVYLYEDGRTSREVAVKVLLSDSLSPGVRDQFESEARLMGQLSTHPSIVTVYNTGIAPDGRPYLVMEYCSEPNLGDRFRTAPLDLPRALDIIVEICGAVETAHRAGILHRDIKPANILVSDYGKAMLTDFGIAAALGGESGIGGLSVPWAPPEFVEGEPGGRESDVWSLAATLYSLLEGRAPFEIPGQDRSAGAQMQRIMHEPLPPMHAPGVPAVLEHTVAVAMAKDPAARFGSALEFGNALRRVQASLRLPESPLLVRAPRPVAPTEPSTVPPEASAEPADGTVLREQSIAPEFASEPRSPESGGKFIPGGQVYIPRSGDHTSSTVARDAGSAPAHRSGPPHAQFPSPEAATATGGGRRGGVVAAAVVVAAVLVGLVVWAAVGGDDEVTRPAEATAEAPRSDPPSRERVPAVVDATGEIIGSDAVFRWSNPDPQAGDSYLWVRTGTGGVDSPTQTDETTVTIPGGPGTCIEISLVRESGRTSADGVEVCAG